MQGSQGNKYNGIKRERERIVWRGWPNIIYNLWLRGAASVQDDPPGRRWSSREMVLLQGGHAPTLLPPLLLLLAFPIHKKSEGKKSFDGVHIGRRRRMEWTNRTANKWRDSFRAPGRLVLLSSLTCEENFLHSRKTNGISQLSRQQEWRIWSVRPDIFPWQWKI